MTSVQSGFLCPDCTVLFASFSVVVCPPGVGDLFNVTFKQTREWQSIARPGNSVSLGFTDNHSMKQNLGIISFLRYFK